MKSDLQDYPRALLEKMEARAIAEQNHRLLADIRAALPKAADYAIDHRDRTERGRD